MKKLFLPYLFNEESHVAKPSVTSMFSDDLLTAYYTLDEAVEAGKKLALKDPKGKVGIFEMTHVIEPRRIEFAEKRFNDKGELLV